MRIHANAQGDQGVESAVAGGREGPSTGAENQTLQGHYGLSWRATSPASVDNFLFKDQIDKTKLKQIKATLPPSSGKCSNFFILYLIFTVRRFSASNQSHHNST